MGRKTVFFLNLLLVLGFFSAGQRILAQGTVTATILGEVTDEVQALVPGVTVTITHLATDEQRVVVTDDAGRYRVGLLPLGEYALRAELPGFQTVLRRGIRLTVGREAVVNFTLTVGTISEQVVVVGEAPLVEATSITLRGLVEEQAIVDLPLNGRSYDNLIALHAGAKRFQLRPSGGSISTGFSQDFSIGGLRPEMNQFLLDGTEYAGTGTGGQTPGGVSGQLLGIDAIKEFEVLRGNYSAEYGKRAAGQINIATRSGTNQYHGTAFYFHRNDNLDARSFLDFNLDSPPEFKRHNFGGSIGGPIITGKTFFFGTYEGLREGRPTSGAIVVPDEQARNGIIPDLSTPDPDDVIVIPISPTVFEFLKLWRPPTPGGRNFGDGTAEAFGNPVDTTRQDFYQVRVDHQFSDRDSLFGRYTIDDGDKLDPTVNFLEAANKARNQAVTIQETHIFSPSVINVAKLGFSRGFGKENQTYTGPDLAFAEPPVDTFVPGQPVGRVRVGAGSGNSSLANAGGAVTINIFQANNFFIYADDLSINKGAHSLKLGVYVQRLQTNEDIVFRKAGDYQFGDLEGLLRGQATGFTGFPPEQLGNTIHPYRNTIFALYVQDAFRLRSNLTLNLGLRYEFSTLPKEIQGRAGNWELVGPGLIPTNFSGDSPLLENNSLLLFAPRVGLAWDPFGDGMTSIRAGIGIFFDQITSPSVIWPTSDNPPFLARVTIDDPPIPHAFDVVGEERRFSPNGINPFSKVPAVVQWNLHIEREVVSNTVLSIGYTGSHSYHLPRSIDPNTRFPVEILPDGTKIFSSSTPRRNPALAYGRYWMYDAESWYNAFELELTHRLSEGLRFKGAYTFSKTMDNASQTASSRGRNGTLGTMDPEDINRDKALSIFDGRQQFDFNFSYMLPGLDSGGVAGALVNGWQINGIATLSSGSPFDIRVGSNRSENGDSRAPDRPNLVAGRDNSPIIGTFEQWYDPTAFAFPARGTHGDLGRNTVEGPGYANFDFSLFKEIFALEGVNMQFRFEFFNIFNHTNFGDIDRLIFNRNGTRRGAAGKVSSVRTSRQIQVGMKIVF